ncbi:MAG: diaminopimelate epimerase [Lachnospiraceae bacterium]|nr:diaminopimelate epimerase [Lachnospiraceae bacterium]
MKFTKMQGCGNDYVYVNTFKEKVEDPAAVSVRVSDRHFGIGSDGLILVGPSKVADVKMNMYNADGSEAQMCGNGVRCVAKFALDNGLAKGDTVNVETLAGIKSIKVLKEEGNTRFFTVDMGEPELDPEKIPVLLGKEKAIKEKVKVDGKEYEITCVSMGNPHAVTFMKGVDELKIEEIGPKFENNAMFPERTNTEFVELIDGETVKMRVWERGSGETLACGTGACAVAVACVLCGYTNNKVKVKLLGGDLEIFYDKDNTNHVFMTGPATTVFEGEID